MRQFFNDPRYLRVNGRPVLVIFRPNDIPEVAKFIDLIQKWAAEDGLGGLYLIGLDHNRALLDAGFDALAPHSMNIALAGYLKSHRRYYQALRRRIARFPRWVIDYASLEPYFENHLCDGLTMLPTALPNWDNTPRIGRRGLVLSNSSPDAFAAHLRRSVAGFDSTGEGGERVLFIKSWNEWAEGNYLEPDLSYGRGWLEAVQGFAQELKQGGRRG